MKEFVQTFWGWERRAELGTDMHIAIDDLTRRGSGIQTPHLLSSKGSDQHGPCVKMNSCRISTSRSVRWWNLFVPMGCSEQVYLTVTLNMRRMAPVYHGYEMLCVLYLPYYNSFEAFYSRYLIHNGGLFTSPLTHPRPLHVPHLWIF